LAGEKVLRRKVTAEELAVILHGFGPRYPLTEWFRSVKQSEGVSPAILDLCLQAVVLAT